ncbi:membrane protein [Ligilactobacillus salitolerans]|uniref:Membrane protein n=1 Tax=Ligilactobacillus salitolerans TaxID=1808352 RepID=A0A401IQD9_9LACO|nr:GtrA family protein [Ligilactobacillus salitolerans]GBG93736.1 membrane protein [Ligilactobacillus salitolerans]
MPQSLKQFIKFCCIGGINTLLTYLIYLLLYHSLGNTVTMGIGYGLTSLIGLLLNNRWVFRPNAAVLPMVIKFYSTYGITWLLSVVFTFAATNWWNITAELIPILSLFLTTPTNFLLSKFWVFKNGQTVKNI